MSGKGALNIFEGIATGEGIGAALSTVAEFTRYDSASQTFVTESTPIDVTFTNITTPGVVAVLMVTNRDTFLGANHSVSAEGFDPIYFDLVTSAGFEPPVEVCVHYQADVNGYLISAPTIHESRLALFHGEGSPRQYFNRTSRLDVDADLLCASVNTLSPFVMAVAVDNDGDGVYGEDNCQTTPNPSQLDNDGDGLGDPCDVCPLNAANDADGDGTCEVDDNCDVSANTDQADLDEDGFGDICDVCPLDAANDGDGDGVCEVDDNCDATANSDQADLDGDAAGDPCDPDIDGDEVTNDTDNCRFDVNPQQSDADRDSAGDACDDDLDGDGVIDADDACLPSPVGERVDEGGCAISELCPCAHPQGQDRWKNHGAYVACVTHEANAFVAEGRITTTAHGVIVSSAAASSCGAKK